MEGSRPEPEFAGRPLSDFERALGKVPGGGKVPKESRWKLTSPEAIRAFLARNLLSPKEGAVVLGVSEAALSRWNCGNRAAPPKQQERLVAAMLRFEVEARARAGKTKVEVWLDPAEVERLDQLTRDLAARTSTAPDAGATIRWLLGDG